ncbi:hypothetical protein C8R47DRAFT_765616 [Mycena vitilis]|nr:hypothetical protein C8R47DRAFT_765616 [Mycena vitilis]
MVSTSRAGCPLPLPEDFDFAAHMRRPLNVVPPSDHELDDINAENCRRETSNKLSLSQTRAYAAAKNSPAGVGALDVGAPLQAYFAYSDHYRELLVTSEAIEKSSGPLPFFVLMEIEGERTKRKNLSESARAQRDQDRTVRDLPAHPALGTMVMTNPRPVSSTISGAPVIPDLWLTSLRNRVIFPLNFWSDTNLNAANDFPHNYPSMQLHNAPGVMVLNVAKAIALMGDESTAKLSPGLWRQCSINNLAAWEILCPKVSRDDPAFVPTPASEYKEHVSYWANQDVFEDTELMPVWLPVEQMLRAKILRNQTFDRAFYDTQWTVAITVYRDSVGRGHASTSSSGSPSFPPASLKRSAPSSESDAAAGPAKVRRTSRASRRSTTPASTHSREGSTPAADRPASACLICTGDHIAYRHPADKTSFADNTHFFAKLDGKDLKTARSFRGAVSSICVTWNIQSPCREHGDDRLHVCSLCGGAHPALSRDAACGRVRDGVFIA